MIVSNVAGTTRDAIDSYFENESGKYLLHRHGRHARASRKVDDASREVFSNLRSIAAIERADVCLILIDANEGVTEQDTKVAGLAHEAGKACIIVVNKWDTVEKDTNTMDEKTAEIRRDLSYMTYAPVVFISALTGQRVDKLFEHDRRCLQPEQPCASPPACSTTFWRTPPRASSRPRTRAAV